MPSSSFTGVHVVMGDRQRLAVVVVFGLLGVDAQGGEPGVEQVADVVLVARRRRCPASFVSPTTTPRLMPQPAIATDQASGQWSRPMWPLIRGVRPNSLIAITSTLSSMPAVGEVFDHRREGLVELAAPGSGGR